MIERIGTASMAFAQVTLRRGISVLPVLLVVSVTIFLLVRLAEGDPAAVLGGDFSDEESLNEVRSMMGLDVSLFQQFWHWAGAVLRGDLGHSLFSQAPVAGLIYQRAGPTLALTICTLVVAVPLSLLIGIVSVWHEKRLADHLATLLAVLGFSVPVFVLGYACMYVFSMQWHWLPVQGYQPVADGVGGFLQFMVLPTLTLSVAYVALLSRMVHNSLLEAMRESYIRTARAQGVGRVSLLFLHALPNAAVPLLTVLGVSLAGLLSGSVVVENMFNIPGIGSLLMDAVNKRDYPVIQGILLVLSIAYVGINFLIDIAYALIDPRIKA